MLKKNRIVCFLETPLSKDFFLGKRGFVCWISASWELNYKIKWRIFFFKKLCPRETQSHPTFPPPPPKTMICEWLTCKVLPKEQGLLEVNACARRSQVVLTSRTPRSKDLTENKKLTWFLFFKCFFCDNQQVSTGYPPSIAEKNNAGYFVK